jgi:hypothetical protein
MTVGSILICDMGQQVLQGGDHLDNGINAVPLLCHDFLNKSKPVGNDFGSFE